MFKIIEAQSQEEINIAKKLFQEYASSIDFNLCFQNFDEELKEIQTMYSPPYGCLLLAYLDNKPIGCVAFRKLEDDKCEMKRMYVKPQYRNKGVGRTLAEKIIEKAKSAGYKKMRLDTASTMKEALSLYRSLGFKEIQPYIHNPIKGTIFLELNL